jgi:hypothetical protein
VLLHYGGELLHEDGALEAGGVEPPFGGEAGLGGGDGCVDVLGGALGDFADGFAGGCASGTSARVRVETSIGKRATD